MLFVSIDTETTLIPDRPGVTRLSGRYVPSRGGTRTPDLVLTGPWVTPRLIVGSYWDGQQGDVLHSGPFLDYVEGLLKGDQHICMHNCAFDVRVLCEARPSLWPLFLTVLEQDRLHDTLLLDQLVRLSEGEFDIPKRQENDTWGPERLQPRSLAKLARAYAGMDLDKDDEVRLGFEQFEGRELPAQFRAYALADAVATYKVFEVLLSKCPEDGLLLSEPLQVRAAVAIQRLDERGVAIDRAEAVRLRELFKKDLPSLQQVLVKEGFGSWAPSKGSKTCVKVLKRDCNLSVESLPTVVGNSPEQRVGQEGTDVSTSLDLGQATPMLIGLPINSGLDPFPPGSVSSTAATGRLVSIRLTYPAELWQTILPIEIERVAQQLGTGCPSGAEELLRIIKRTTEKNTALIARVKNFKQHSVLEVAEAEFHLSQNLVRRELETLLPDLTEAPPRTDTGMLSLDGDFWRKHIPAAHIGLNAWERHCKLIKILSVYLNLYSSIDRVFCRWKVLGARSGRMSAAGPNLQNIPAHKHGIRAVFVPSPGYCFIEADFSFAELITLVETMLQFGIKGPLYDAIQNGDPHSATASFMTGRPVSEIGKKSPERQAAKACNFGFPGALGARKFADYAEKTYGLRMTPDEAKEKREKFLAVYPDIAEYLKRMNNDLGAGLLRATGRGIGAWKRELGVEGGILDLKRAMRNHPISAIRGALFQAEHSLQVALSTGRRRSGCLYTEACNTFFQGLASDVCKQAVWLAETKGLRTVLIVHDSIVIEAGTDWPEKAALLRWCMLEAFRQLCPQVGQFAQVEVTGPLARWGKATGADGIPV